MNTAYILLGANLGDRKLQLEKASSLLSANCGPVIRSSPLYETAAWGNTDQPSFYNQAIELETNLNARQLIRKILKIEKKMGRIRAEKLGPRIIDIDILLFNDELHNTTFLKVPHPEMQNRRFALTPLNDIAPNMVHPVLKKTITTLLQECKDTLTVMKVL